MTRILVCLFGTTIFLLTSNSFAGDRSRGCRSNCPPVNCVTAVSNGCASCGTSCPPVEYCMSVSNGCASCSGGVHQNGDVYTAGGANTTSGANIASGANADSGTNTASGANAGSGATENGGGSVTGGGRLDPDVLTGQTDGPLGQQDISTERIWTDSSGKHKRLARFVGMEGTKVILMNAQGRTTRIDVVMLSAADQLLANQLSKKAI